MAFYITRGVGARIDRIRPAKLHYVFWQAYSLNRLCDPFTIVSGSISLPLEYCFARYYLLWSSLDEFSTTRKKRLSTAHKK